MKRFLRIIIGFFVAMLLVMAFFALSPHAHAATNGIKIMPLGDSITWGTQSSDGGGYRTALWNDFTRDGYNVNFVGSQTSGPSTIDTNNEGHPGWRIDQISANIVNWLTTYQPQIILLHIGTNDFNQNYSESGAPTRLSALIDQITTTSPNATLIVAQIIPLTNSALNSQGVIAYNATIPGIVQAKAGQGKHVEYVDMYDAVPTSDLVDKIHPNDTGYGLMANVWYKALRPLLPLSSGFSNTGISDNSAPTTANFDGNGYSYSAQALQAAGITPGTAVFANGITFPWPLVSSGAADNYQANGQTITVNPVANATTLGLLGAATNGPSSGTATITYTDNSTQAFTLAFGDWTLNHGTATVLPGNSTVATLSPRNGPTGQQTRTTYVFATDIALQAGKTVKNVILPTTVTQGLLHVFAIGTKATLPTSAPYSSVGISTDSNPTSADYDWGGYSYSAQALATAGVTPGKTVTSNGVSFIWPNVGAGAPDNYLADGQTIAVAPVANATSMAFLGSATGGPASGTATITFTDNSTQTFTLALSDWTLNGGTATVLPGDSIAATTTYRNGTTGQQTRTTDVFYTSTSIPAGKTIKLVTLPSTVTQGTLHIFAISTK